MPMPKKVTPMGLISSIMTLAAFIGLVFTVDARYITKAEAADKTSDVIQQQQMDRVETDIALVELEIKFQEEVAEHADDDSAKRDAEKRLNYLEQRKLILEKYQLELATKD